jgi:hypothetical protein
MSNPMIDRKVYWRVIEWDPVERVAYGIMGGDSMLFRYDPDDGPEGTVTPLVRMCAEQYLHGPPQWIPFSTLALTIAPNRRLYYAPVLSVAFDYSGQSWDVADERRYTAQRTGEVQPPLSVLVEYDLATGQRRELGQLRIDDGRRVYGLGGACTGRRDGQLYFVGAVEERDPQRVANRIEDRWPYSMALLRCDPAAAAAERGAR